MVSVMSTLFNITVVAIGVGFYILHHLAELPAAVYIIF